MLMRIVRRAGPVLALASVFLLVAEGAAQADSGPGGNPFGSVVCGQGYTASCVVSAGSPGAAQVTSADPAGPAGNAGGGGNGCIAVNALNTTTACPLPAGGAAPAAAGGAPPAPGVLAALAVRRLVLPDPVIGSSPGPGVLQLTRLPTWLWISPAVWVPQAKTAAVPGEVVTATATPVAVAWRMGDGTTVTCHGPGTPYSSRFSPSAASPDCGHTYTRSSAGQPGGAYRVTATITWDITWAALGGAVGVLPPLFTVAAGAFPVAESQAVNTAAGGA
jgi:hypothetical protein